jgi:hypothetical protein
MKQHFIKRPHQLVVGDTIIVSESIRFTIEKISPGVAGIMCPIIEGIYSGSKSGKGKIDIGASPRLQDHEFEVEPVS